MYLSEHTVIDDDVLITATGAITNHRDHSPTLTITGNIINNGSIYNWNTRSLTVRLQGDITNNGSWSNNYTHLDGTTDQNISCGGTGAFSGSHFYNNNTGNVIATGDLNFTNCNADFQDLGNLDLSGGFDIYADDSILYDFNITGGNGSTINMVNGDYAYDLEASDIILDGEVILWGADCNFTGSLINNGTITNYISGSAVLGIEGDFVNNGDIFNWNCRYITLNLEGDVTNNGTWTHHYTNFTGTTDQTIICGAGSSFAGLYCDNTNTGSIIAGSDITFVGCDVDFQDIGILDLSGGFVLYADDSILYDLNVIGGNGATINMSNGRYAYDLEASDIILDGEVILWGADFSFTGLLTNNGIMKNYISGSAVLGIEGDFVNNGDIFNWNSRYITLNLEGDVTNNGTWTHHYTNFAGTSDQTIVCGSGSSFAGLNCTNTNTGSLIAGSDISFVDCNVDFNNIGVLDISAGYNLNVSDGYLYNIYILGGNGTELNMSDGAYFYYSSAEDIILSGITEMYGTCDFPGYVINTGTITNFISASNVLNVAGDFTNNGIITDWNGRQTTLNISGDITNNGTWENYYTYLTGTDQHITNTPGNPFTGEKFYGNPTRGNIYLDSDVDFIDVDFDLNSNNLILQDGNTLFMDTSKLFDGSVVTAGDNTRSILNMINDSRLYTLSVEDTELQGICNLQDNNVTFENSVVVTGTLANHTSYYITAYVNGSLVNNGTITEFGNRTFDLYISGDIENNGIWTNEDTFLDGSTVQHISCSGASVFNGYTFQNNNANNIIADSDLYFNTRFDFLDNGSLDLSGGYTLYTDGAYYYRNIDIIGGNNAEIHSEGDSYLRDASISNIVLSGTISQYGTITYTGDTTINGSFRNHASTHPTVNMANVINNGTIENVNTRYMNLFISGDVVNNGSWNNYYNKFDGTIDQTITLENSSVISGNTTFISDITGSNYQWYFDSAILDSPDFTGETTQNLNWSQDISEPFAGTYNCIVDGTPSRNIIVTSPSLEAPAGITITVTSSDIELDWDDVTGATSYTVYSDSDPYGSFTISEWTGAVSEWSEAIPGDTKYYRVTASN